MLQSCQFHLDGEGTDDASLSISAFHPGVQGQLNHLFGPNNIMQTRKVTTDKGKDRVIHSV